VTKSRRSGNSAPHIGDDLRGLGRLAVDAVTGVAHIAEGLHRNISGRASIVGASRQGPTKGITGLVYSSVRGVSRLVGHGLDAALTAATPLLAQTRSPPIRDAAVAALNGVFGDHLERRANPLAIHMQLRRDGHALELNPDSLRAHLPDLGPKPLLLIHGLCLNDRQWLREGHDHGAALARDLGFTPIYLFYNSGRHVADNGRELAALLQQLVDNWPVPIESLHLLGHSMGGLVARSAIHHATQESLPWATQLTTLSCLGTPHHGAPLERAGSWADAIIGFSPYTAPFMKLGESRSAGIKDLRFGRLIDTQTQHPRHRDTRAAAPLPSGVRCHAIAATRAALDSPGTRKPGDGLVPIPSALGLHRDPRLSLDFPESQRFVAHECSHFDLLNKAEVYQRLHDWLALAAE
jgi:pimeloyl-ACP methyl ester carboxylesterase